MYSRDLTTEASPDTLTGSINRDQLLSRIWISKKLSEFASPKTVAILGSWYGILPYVLHKFNNIDDIYAIDNKPKYIKISKKLNPTVKHICTDCNDIDYSDIDCIINPSINNIEGTDWYDNIPSNKLCVFQTENIEVSNDCPYDLISMKKKYPLSKYLYSKSVKCIDTDGHYTRSMVIGYK